MGLFLLYYACLVLRYPDVEVNPGPRVGTSGRCRLMFCNINGLFGNLSELSVAASGFDLVMCAETKVSTFRHSSELLLPGFVKPTLLLRGARPNGLGLALYVRDGFCASRQTSYECSCCEMLVVRVCGSRQNFYVFCVYRSPNTDDRVFDCMLASMARIQSMDKKAVFCFLGDFNCHHQEWLGSPRTDSHGRMARDFSSLSDCRQLVVGPTHRDGGTLDLVLTDVPDLCKVSLGCHVGRSDHAHLSIELLVSMRVPGFCVQHQMYLKSRVRWDMVEQDIADLPWTVIRHAQSSVEVLDDHLLRIIRARVPQITIRTRNGDKAWFNDECRRVFDRKQAAYLNWCRARTRDNWQLFVHSQREANACYARVRREYFARCKEKLGNSVSSHAWWRTLKESVFGVASSIPPLFRRGGGLAFHPQEKAELLSDVFDGKQSRETLDLPPTCSIRPKLTSFAFRSREVLRLLSDLDSQGGTDPLGFFPLFFRKVAIVLAPKLSIIFRSLIKDGCFPKSWCSANVVPVPKGSSSSFPNEYRPISLTPVLSKIFEKLVAARLGEFFEREQCLPPRQYAYRKGLGTCDALLDICHSGQVSLEMGNELRIVQIDFSAAFDRVNHVGLLYKLRSAGIGGSLLSIVQGFLSGRTQKVVLDGVASRVVSVVSGVPQGSVLGPLLFLLYTSELSSIVENTLITYADDSTLLATIPSPTDRLLVSDSLNRDLCRISEWCVAWGMKVNPSKTKSMVVSRSRTVLPVHPSLSFEGQLIEDESELRVLGVVLDCKLSFEPQLRAVAASASQKLGILRKAWTVYRDSSLLSKCFWSFLLPVLEYCSPVWRSAADCHLKLLDRVIRSASLLSSGAIQCDLGHRRLVASLCMFYKIRGNPSHPMSEVMPAPYIPSRATRYAASRNDFAVALQRTRTLQFSRSFVPWCSRLWNELDNSAFASEGLSGFKSKINRFCFSD